jgi:hypothetical protein
VKEIHGLCGHFGYYKTDGISDFTIVTNLRTYGPYGDSKGIEKQMPFNIPVKNNGSIVGFFGHCNKSYVTAIGFYVKPF